MRTEPQVYYDADGHEHELSIDQGTMETLVDDELRDINKLYMAIRNMRAMALNEERAMQETTQKALSKSISVMQSSLEKMADPLSRWHAEENEFADKMRDSEGPQMEVDEPELSPEEAEALDHVKRTMLLKIYALERGIQSLKEERPCPTRKYIHGVYKDAESKMRCSFCGARGKHYSDSCPRIRDSVRRKLLLKKQNRCKICLEIGCLADFTCPKYWNRCFHCTRMGHHSAVCDWPDKAQEIEDEINETRRELTAAKTKVSTICMRLGIKEEF